MAGSLRPGSAVALALFAVGCLSPAWAEVFHFDNMPIPEPYSMTIHRVFYVYSKEDAPRKQESASVVFRNLGAKLAGNSRFGRYDSVQVSLLPFDSLFDIMDNSKFCGVRDGVNGELMLRRVPAASHAAIHAVPFPAAGSPQNVEFQITKTGRYVLAYSNCGIANTSATVTGSVLVKNPYGFLPGNEYSNLNFHGWCAVIYLVLSALWISVYVRFFQSTSFIQTGIAGISALCLLESSLSWLMYKDWNSTGNLSDFLVLSSTACHVLKYVLAWRLLQLSFLGIGLFQDDHDTMAAVKFFLSYMLFAIQESAWKVVMSERYALQLNPGFVTAVALPGFFIYAALFLLSFLAFMRLLDRLEEEKKEMALVRFRKAQRVLIAAAVGSCLVAALQAVEIASREAMPWNYQFLVSSGAANLVFMMALTAMMLVWLPSEDSWKLTYTQQATVDADEDGAGIAEKAEAADGLPGELEGEEPMPRAQAREVRMKPSTVTPEPIGAREDEEQPKVEVEDAMLL